SSILPGARNGPPLTIRETGSAQLHHPLSPRRQERLPAAACQLSRRQLPERVVVLVPEDAVVGEDLEVVRAAPAGVLEAAQDLGDRRDSVAGKDAIGPAAGRLPPVADVDADDPAAV